jgi:hypothetical protein
METIGKIPSIATVKLILRRGEIGIVQNFACRRDAGQV